MRISQICKHTKGFTMTIFLTITAVAAIMLIAWAGMRLMQRTTGCDTPRRPPSR